MRERAAAAAVATLAQVNLARGRAPLDGPEMADFVARIDELNALADASPGFVWRLQTGTGAGGDSYLRPYDDDRILFNLSVWRTVEALRAYVYRSVHADVMRRRNEWFEKFDGAYTALWWIPRRAHSVGRRGKVTPRPPRSPRSDRDGLHLQGSLPNRLTRGWRPFCRNDWFCDR